ncbi:hypothetical protein HHI36_013082 [Cryptolaemus montrouzieri]|uniref:Uncharacterized protein n=1 Tax=Cryptolaemus montrouzieri TaxID=559131 RepID=A0ABD2NH67_9CUCU
MALTIPRATKTSRNEHILRKKGTRNEYGCHQNEIGFLLTDERNIFKVLSVLNSFTTESDHRMVRGRIIINSKQESRRRCIKPPPINPQKITHFKEIFRETLKEIELSEQTKTKRLKKQLIEAGEENGKTEKEPEP